MPRELTVTSAVEYDRIRYGRMTPAMAVEYLQGEQLPMRTFSGVIRQMYPRDDLQMRLVDFFLTVSPQLNPDSIVRKVRNWLSGRNVPANREDLFAISFALDFGEEELDYLLSMCTDYGIQYRDGHDAVLAWFLRNSYGYQEARKFLAEMPTPPGLNKLDSAQNTHLTREVQNEFLLARSLEGLRQCYLKNLPNFGTLHLRAYYYFEKFLNLLIHPVPEWLDIPEPYYSIETIMQTYLSMNMPSGAKRENYSLVQRLIKQNWPNATALKNIRLHKEDVPRKLLLLLYVITEGSAITLGQEDDEDMTMAERIEEHWWMLNAMLGDCGMALLDPRNVCDWLILYAIGAEEDGTAMSDRLEQVIELMYDGL